MNKESIGIYGCGECGIQTWLFLNEHGIKINFFGDRNKGKQGYVIDGLFCISYDQLLQLDRNDTVLIVAIAQGEGICVGFRDMGFKKVIYYKELTQMLSSDIKNNKKTFDQPNAAALREIKQSIETLAFQTNIHFGEKRDRMLHLLENEEIKKG